MLLVTLFEYLGPALPQKVVNLGISDFLSNNIFCCFFRFSYFDLGSLICIQIYVKTFFYISILLIIQFGSNICIMLTCKSYWLNKLMYIPKMWTFIAMGTHDIDKLFIYVGKYSDYISFSLEEKIGKEHS